MLSMRRNFTGVKFRWEGAAGLGYPPLWFHPQVAVDLVVLVVVPE
jgi:hypothetical protein